MMVVPVLHVVDSLDNEMGGMIHAALNVCSMLAAAGISVEIGTTRGPRDDVRYVDEKYPYVPVRAFPRRFPHHYFNSPALRRWLTSHVREYPLVEIHGVFSFTSLYAAAACRRADVPYLVHPHGSLDPFDLQKHRMMKRLYGPLFLRRILYGAERVLLTTDMEAERIETYGAEVQREVIPLPLESEVAASRGRDEIRHTLGIPRDAMVVLFIGRIDRKKGLQFLIPSLAAAKVHFPNVWFLLVGSGDHAFEQEVTTLLSENGVNAFTVRTGFLSGVEKQEAFVASDLMALPSLMENFGIVVVEALRAGLPLLLSTEVYTHHVVEKEGAAVICEPTTDSCTSALLEILDPDVNERMTARAAPSAEKHFSTKAALEPLLELYARLGVT